VVRVALDAAGNPTPLGQHAFLLARPIWDVFTDDGGARLLIRSPGDTGTTWSVFDTASSRFTSFASTSDPSQPAAAGIDPVSGRFYGLSNDGLLVADARQDPISAPENVRPDLGSPSHWRIAVDPPTRRFFVRRGAWWSGEPVEPFYRVFQDRIPLPG
jgi:hypothetical protein